MITRFRVEAEHEDKEQLLDLLPFMASRFIAECNEQPDGEWECTQDVNSFDDKRKLHVGRMVLVFRRAEAA